MFYETSAKELSETNCYLKHRCSKLFLIDVVFCLFCDRIYFTLTTLEM